MNVMFPVEYVHSKKFNFPGFQNNIIAPISIRAKEFSGLPQMESPERKECSASTGFLAAFFDCFLMFLALEPSYRLVSAIYRFSKPSHDLNQQNNELDLGSSNTESFWLGIEINLK